MQRGRTRRIVLIVPIDQISLPLGSPAAELWPAVAAQTQRWLGASGVSARDAVLLLPYAALLPPARAALAAAGGWQPRVETVLTLAASLSPPMPAGPGACTGDTTHDRLTASALLRRQAWGAAWAARDAAGFARITALVVDAAQALRAAALVRCPASRDDFWTHARSQLGAAAGPAATEALLLRLAVEWAAASDSADTDRLFEHRPGAWIVLRIGGPDALAEALLGHADTPSLHLLADPPVDDPYAAVAATAHLTRHICDDFEGEAQATAAEVIAALNAGRTPVALVALDRELVRRVRALLERESVPLLDETGWLLATTRAAANVMALLRAALSGAGPDARLAWLKTWPPAAGPAIDALEAVWRGRRHVADRPAGEALWRAAQSHLQALAAGGVQSIAQWLALLHECLHRDSSHQRWAADPAGAQVLAALGWPAAAPWRDAAAEVRTDLHGFIAWVESSLEHTPFLPPPDFGAQVVITPLARAYGRAVGQVVVPGADHLRLGASGAPPSLISDGLAARLGLPHAQTRRSQQRLAFAQLLRAPRVTLLRRLRDDDEPLAESPETEWLLLARQRAGAPPWPAMGWQPAWALVPLAPLVMPRPSAAAALPEVLSASQLDALRQCPYRFFARAVLRLDEPEELEAALAKRDYGNWLHAVLHRFHSQRSDAVPLPAQLQDAADVVTQEQGVDSGELLPYRASFETFAPRYLAWLALREASGWQWQEGETDHEREPVQLAGLRLRGRIDRLDHGPAGTRQLLDYKTGSAAALAQRVRDPLEDTQLAFYAALLGGDAQLGAAYLALDDARAPREIAHRDVHASAAVLIENLADEWQRLRQGAALPALGEGRVCDTCEARGLCRKDHWTGA